MLKSSYDHGNMGSVFNNVGDLTSVNLHWRINTDIYCKRWKTFCSTISSELLLLKVFFEMFCGRSLVLLIGSVLLFCETNPIVRKSVFPRNFRQSVGQELACTNCLNKILFHCTHSFSSLCKSSHLRCSIKKLFLKISQYSQKNTCVEVSFK